MKKGFVLIVVLAVLALLTGAAILLHANVTTDARITHNIRLYHRARNAAESGLTHFKTLGYHYEDVQRAGIIEIEGTTSSLDAYKVTAMPGSNFTFYVRSVGSHKKGKRVLASAVLSATFKSFWVPIP